MKQIINKISKRQNIPYNVSMIQNLFYFNVNIFLFHKNKYVFCLLPSGKQIFFGYKFPEDVCGTMFTSLPRAHAWLGEAVVIYWLAYDRAFLPFTCKACGASSKVGGGGVEVRNID